MKQLRPYQDAANKSLFKYLFENPGKQPLVVAPVAAGKSLMISEFIRQLHQLYPRTRIVMLTHVKELLIQNAEELDGQYFGCDMGFYCAGLNQKRLHNDVTFASIQSINNKVGDFNRIPEIIIIDECHLISHNENTTYRKFIDTVLAINPNCRIIGFTGTPFRADTGRLDEGHNKLFDGIAYEIGMDFMIEQGYWAKPVCPSIATKMAVTGVSVRGGDYVSGELEKAINVAEITDPCIKELIEKGIGRKRWLIFTAGVQHAEDVTEALNRAGISARCVHSDKASDENTQNLEDHKKGKYLALVNVAKLTTGYNDPYIDLLVFMRPTRSPVLYVQTTGRGVRPVYADGYDLSTQAGRLDAIANSIKPDCMILDFGNVVGTLGPIDQVSIKKKYTGEKEAGGGEAIMKICPSCGTECAAAQKYCYNCSYCFIHLEKTASTEAVVSRDVEPEWMDVLQVYHNIHFKEGGMPSMKATYFTMQGSINEWICFEHHNFDIGDNKRFAWDKAVAWHALRFPDMPPPTSIEDALEINYPKPSRILARRDGKYWRVLDYEFGRDQEVIEHKINEDEYFSIPF